MRNIYTNAFSSSRAINSKIIHYVSAPCSTGKTDSACEYIKENQRHRNFLYVAPSLDLVNETHQTLRNKGVEASVITSQTHPFAVKKNIIDHLDSCDSFESVLCITWQSYVDLDFFAKRPQVREQWTPIIDETPGMDEFFPRILPRNIPFLTEIVEVGEIVNDKIAKVVVKNQTLLEELYRSADDERDTIPFRPWYGALLSPGKEMFVDLESWSRFVIGSEISKERSDSEKNAVYFLSMLRPEPFENAILVGRQRRKFIGLPLDDEASWLSVRRTFGNQGSVA